MTARRIIGLDPGLGVTGWGVIEMTGSRLAHVANGVVATRASDTLAPRLQQLYDGLTAVLQQWRPHEAAVEETFVNRNAQSTLRLGLARGVVLLAPARSGIEVAEYGANQVKKSVTGTGHAAKEQVMMMVGTLLPKAEIENTDAADALAVAICHAHFLETAGRLNAALAGAAR